MPKEILLYSSVYSYSVADFITQMEEAKGDDVVVRINTPGGEVYSGFGIIAKFQEHQKGKKVKVDGRADSFGAIICCYAEDVECLDVSTFLFHRAAYPEWIERSEEMFTEDMKKSLGVMNSQLRAAMEGKMKAEDFKKETGYSLDEIFSLDNRLDVVLTAKQAKKLGLVNKVTAITPEKKAEVESKFMAMAAMSWPAMPEASKTEQPQNKIMTAAEFKAAHPAAYAEIVKEGATAERDRVGAYMAYADVDIEAVKKGITEGGPMTQTLMADLSRKQFNAAALTGLEKDNAKQVTTTEAGTNDADKSKDVNAEAFKKELYANLGIKA